jgi:hypothetical protein
MIEVSYEDIYKNQLKWLKNISLIILLSLCGDQGIRIVPP